MGDETDRQTVSAEYAELKAIGGTGSVKEKSGGQRFPGELLVDDLEKNKGVLFERTCPSDYD